MKQIQFVLFSVLLVVLVNAQSSKRAPFTAVLSLLTRQTTALHLPHNSLNDVSTRPAINRALLHQEDGWTTLSVGQSMQGIRYDQSGAVIINNNSVMLCPNPQTGPDAALYLSRPSPLKKFVLVLCSQFPEDHAYIIDTVNSKIASRDVAPEHWMIFRWVSWSPDEKYALVGAAGEITMGDMAFVDLATGRTQELNFKNFTNENGLDPRKTAFNLLQDFDPDSVTWLSPSQFVVKLDVRCNPYEVGDGCYDKIISSHPVRVNLSPFNIVYEKSRWRRRVSHRQESSVASINQNKASPVYRTDGAVKLTAVRTLTTKPVKAVTFAPDFSGIASVGAAETPSSLKDLIQFWRAEGSILSKTVFTGNCCSGNLALAPDGTSVAVGDDGTIQVWETRSWTIARTLKMPLDPNRTYNNNGSVVSLSYSPNGRIIAGTNNELLCVWDLASETPKWCQHTRVADEENPFGGIYASLALSPDGGTVAVGGGISPSQIIFFDIQTGKILQSWTVSGNVETIAYSPNGQLLAVGGGWDGILNGVLELRDTNTGTVKIAMKLQAENTYVNTLAFSPNGNTLLTGSNDKVRLWNSRAGKLLSTLPVGGVNSVGFSSNGKLLTIGGEGGISVWRYSNY